MKLNKFDYISVASSVAAAVGLILTLIGCLIFSAQEGIGVNLSLSPMVYVGVAVIILGLIAAIVANVLYRKNDMNRTVATVAIYLSVIAFMVMTILIAYTILIPVLNPSNG